MSFSHVYIYIYIYIPITIYIHISLSLNKYIYIYSIMLATLVLHLRRHRFEGQYLRPLESRGVWSRPLGFPSPGTLVNVKMTGKWMLFIFLNTVLSCIIMYYHVSSCIIMYYHALSYIIMYYHLLSVYICFNSSPYYVKMRPQSA